MSDWPPSCDPAATRTFTREIFADYFQFSLEDQEAPLFSDAELSEFGEIFVDKRIYARPGVVVIGTVRNMTVGVSIEIHEREPQLELAPWDHVTEAALAVSSGSAVLMGCTEYKPDAFRFPLPPEDYRVRVLSGGFDSLSYDGLDGEDHYRLQVWPAAPTPPTVRGG